MVLDFYKKDKDKKYNLEILTYLGHQIGTIIPKTQNKILKHFEGVICQVK